MKTVNQYPRMHSSSTTPAIVFLAAALGLAGLAGCEREGPAEEAGKEIDQTAERAAANYEDVMESASERAEEAGGFIDDTAITGKIDAGILGDPMLKVLQIGVTTTNGVVTLSGVVDSQQSIDRALAIAREVAGVASVDNGLVVQ